MAQHRESELRDLIASDLSAVESDLSLIGTEYRVTSADGADGRIDILAEDATGHFVVIELKRSSATAREALHELSKYITLLQEQEGLGRDELRCVIMSTDWHELLVPFSYFRSVADVSVEGKQIKVGSDNELIYQDVVPVDVRSLPTFSPEFDLFIYSSHQERDEHIAHIAERANALPFLRAAIILLDPRQVTDSPSAFCRSIVCLWRIHDRHHAQIEETCGFKIGELAPYAFPGWESECDVLYWLASESSELGFPGSMEAQRGTAEKVNNLLGEWDIAGIVRLGRLAGNKTLNTEERVVNLLRGQNPRMPLERQNPHWFRDTAESTHQKSWDATTAAFLRFISNVPLWHQEARRYLTVLSGTGDEVHLDLVALRKKHIFYSLYQAMANPRATLSWFQLTARNKNGHLISQLYGRWSWDGTCPKDAEAAIRKVYGSLDWARLSLFSAVDTKSYDKAFALHGLHPIVIHVHIKSSGEQSLKVIPEARTRWTDIRSNPLCELLQQHPKYRDAIARVFQGIPVQPSQGAAVITIANE